MIGALARPLGKGKRHHHSVQYWKTKAGWFGVWNDQRKKRADAVRLAMAHRLGIMVSNGIMMSDGHRW